MADWLRSRPSRLLLWAALIICLGLGAGVVMLTGTESNQPAAALGDDEAAAQVMTAARRAVDAAQLSRPVGGYAYLSCSAEDGPPYQAAPGARFGHHQVIR